MRNSRSLNYEQALSRTAELCSRCEQCTPDLRKKMSTWGVPAGDADRVIRKLEELNFVDDFHVPMHTTNLNTPAGGATKSYKDFGQNGSRALP